MLTSDWKNFPEKASLQEDEAHVWTVFLPELASRQETLARILSTDERDRAGRFQFPRDAQNYTLSHGALRIILSGYVNLPPSALRFAYNSQGKPEIAGAMPAGRIHFNLTHSCDLAMVAIANGGPIGIDVEKLKAPLADAQVASFFSPGEIAVLRSLSPSTRTEVFFHCWTRKEAYLKARGDGLSFPLHRFEVSLAEPPPEDWLRVEGHAEEGKRWRLFSLKPAPGYLAALVVPRQVVNVISCPSISLDSLTNY